MFLFGVLFVFFFKQKTAYEMRISDWSSDVCSSDLVDGFLRDLKDLRAARIGLLDAQQVGRLHVQVDAAHRLARGHGLVAAALRRGLLRLGGGKEIGRASCREGVCQYV